MYHDPNSDSFYDNPRSYTSSKEGKFFLPPLVIRPETGMAIIHFPATAPHAGGYVDMNTAYKESKAKSTKYMLNQFIYASEYRLSVGSSDRPSG